MSVTMIASAQIAGLSAAPADFAASAAGRNRMAAAGAPVPSFAMELAGSAKTQKSADPFVQLEAVFLRSFVEDMMPVEGVGMFSLGLAGEYWRSMLAEQMANAMAAQGRTGIAEILRSGPRAEQTLGG